MNVEHLKEDELLVECEVRGLRDSAERITAMLKDTLDRQLKEEQELPMLVPEKAHEAAQNQPQHEATICLKKLQEIQQSLTEKLAAGDQGKDVIPEIQSRLLHVRGRISRSMASPTFYALAGKLMKGQRLFFQLLVNIRNNKVSTAEAQEQVGKLLFELPKSVVSKVSRGARIQLRSVGSDEEVLDGHQEEEKHYHPGTSQQMVEPAGSVRKTQNGRENRGSLQTAPLQYLGGDFVQQISRMALDQEVEEETGKQAQADMFFDLSSQNHSKGHLSDAKLRREVSTWKVRFEGPRSDLTIERFLARVEWHAQRAQIPLDDLVGVLDLCLEGEALDWFWTAIDRYPGATWALLKREMMVRFETCRTDDDIRRLLNSRK